jgi:hypothetical protein
VVVGYACSFQCDSLVPDPQRFTLVESGGDVPGTVILTQTQGNVRFIVFKPQTGALTANRTYTPELEGIEGFNSFTATTAVSWSSTRPITEVIDAVDQSDGEEVCCSGPVDSCGNPPCFSTEIERQAMLSLRWDGFDDGTSPEFNQYAYRIHRPGESADPPWAVGSVGTTYFLDMDETTTCYTLELRRLVDDAVLALGERCVERPADIVLGTHPTDPEHVGAVLAYCSAAPPGYEEQRCDAMRSLCSANAALCARVAEECPMIGDGGAGGADTGGGGSGGAGATSGGASNGGSTSVGGSSGRVGSSGGSTGDAPGSSDGGATDDVGDGRTVTTKGCGCSVPSARASRGASLAVLGVLAWWTRRRLQRARRPHRIRC